MDNRERLGDSLVSRQMELDGRQAIIWTAMPGILQSFNSTAITAVVQIAVQPQVLDPSTSTWKNQTIGVCSDCPVKFPWGGGFGLTLPLQEGDEGLLVLGSRCIDAWWQSGGVQPQAELRMHDLSDGFFLPGVFSQPRVIPNISTTRPQFRNAAGTLYVELDGDTDQVNVVATGGLWVNGVRVVVP
jgi:hypothetical protein